MKKSILLVTLIAAAVSFANPPQADLGKTIRPPKQDFGAQVTGKGTLLELPDQKNRVGDPVPEPATMAALAMGAGALIARRRKKSQA